METAMSYAAHILPEFDEEMAKTRTVIERIPEDKYGWQAHAKSRTLGWNANHLAEIPGWVEGTIKDTQWDFSPPDGPAYETPALASRVEILAMFDQNVAAARQAIERVSEQEMTVPWTLKYQGEALFTMPRSVVIRSFVLNHMIHHRAISCVYLRLNDVPVPGMYGPSGDE
jgi:uncharacterized damage-inducible protein DinB